MAALVEEINRRDAKHIITIEAPIEYEHTNQRSVIQQVEVGIDAPDFPTALRSALRQSPDVIVIGEMRDTETMRIALAAGETGHLVLSTLHTTDTASTIARMTDSFPDERQPTIRQEIAAALAAVYVQTLLPRVGGGRVPAAQALMVGYGSRQHIRRNTLQHLHQEITITRKHGSFTLEECLARLVKAGIVDKAEAMLRAQHTYDFEHALAN
jgi:twitching motility protein PilT